MRLYQTKKLLRRKETASKTKQNKQKIPTEWEKVVANNSSDKELISKIHKELIQLNAKQKDNPSKHGQKTWTDTSPKKTFKWPTDILKRFCPPWWTEGEGTSQRTCRNDPWRWTTVWGWRWEWGELGKEGKGGKDWGNCNKVTVKKN